MSAIIPYLQPGAITNVQSDITDLQALSGMPDNSLTHGTFSGVTIPDGQTTKQALQALETEVELRDSDIIQSKVGTGPGYRFDGVDDVIRGTSNGFSSNIFTVVSNFSVKDLAGSNDCFWSTNNTGDNRIILKCTAGAVQVFSENVLAFNTYIPAGFIQEGRKHCVVTVSDGTTVTGYVDGKKIGSISYAIGSLSPTRYEIGSRASLEPFNGEIDGTRYYNRALTASEVAQVSNGQNLGFADYGASGAASYESNPSGGGGFAVDTNGWTNSVGVSVSGNIDSVDGEDNTLRLTSDTSTGSHVIYKSGVFTKGKRFRVSFRYYIPSSNSNADGIRILQAGSDQVEVYTSGTSAVLDAWTDVSAEFVAGGTSVESWMLIQMTDGAAVSFTDAGGDDVIYLKDIVVTPLGLVLDLNPNGAAPAIWADASGNGYNGTVTGATLINQQPLHADTFVSLTNLPTSSAGLATGQIWNDSGTLKIV